ncbi:hypothetical protein HYV74_04320 [Candidatus Uhrbacteria bacterium]|nr:hypothetical protein [Candidatus Uhrbacteria bacterium]
MRFRRENGEIRDGIAESRLPAYWEGTPISGEVIPAEYRRSQQEWHSAIGPKHAVRADAHR